jgi:hypothetical protein
VDIPKNKDIAASSDVTRKADGRRIRILWVGLGIYFLIMLNTLRFAYRVPYQVLVAGGLINLAIIAAIIVSMRRVYRRSAR